MWGRDFSLCYLQQQTEMSQQSCEGMNIITQKSFHTLNNVLIHTRLTLTTALAKCLSQNSQSCFVHIAVEQTNFYFVGENKYDMHRKFKWRYNIKYNHRPQATQYAM